jgi:hypothetical protein
MVPNPIGSRDLKPIFMENKVKDTEMKNVFQSKSMEALKKSKYDYVLLYMMELIHFIFIKILKNQTVQTHM